MNPNPSHYTLVDSLVCLVCNEGLITRVDVLFYVWQHKRDVQKTTKYVELIIVADNREVGQQRNTTGLTDIVVQVKKLFFV